MTAIFFAVVATIILPLAMGASALRQLFITEHTTIYVAAGLFSSHGPLHDDGWSAHLPIPGDARTASRAAEAFTRLACSPASRAPAAPPVLAGVIALSAWPSPIS